MNSNILIRIFIVEIATLFGVCQCKNFEEQLVANRVEIDRLEAEKYEPIHESCVFFNPFFPT